MTRKVLQFCHWRSHCSARQAAPRDFAFRFPKRRRRAADGSMKSTTPATAAGRRAITTPSSSLLEPPASTPTSRSAQFQSERHPSDDAW